MKLRILGKLFDVNFISVEELPKDLGECNDTTQAIKIRSDLHPETQADVLLHEVLHGIDLSICTKLTERQIHAIATGLLAVIYDNPHFMEWICRQKSRPHLLE